MIKLIQKLADCDNSFFGGWLLSRAEIHIRKDVDLFSNNLLLHKKNKAIMQVLGSDNTGKIQQELKTLLLLPKRAIVKSSNEKEDEFSKELMDKNCIYEHCFNDDEIKKYVELSGDKNIIHQTKNPIVPGLLMALSLQNFLKLEMLHWQIDFLAPVFSEDVLRVYAVEDKLKAYVNGKNVFNIVIKSR